MKKVISFFIVGAMTTAGISLAQEPTGVIHRFTLEECLNYASGNNLNRQSLKLSEDAGEDTYKQSKIERAPNVSGSVNEGFSSNNSNSNSSAWNGTYTVNVNMPLYAGGSISNTIEQNKLRMKQTTYQTSQFENELTIQILQAFLSVLGNEELLNYQEAVIRASEEQMKQGKEQLRVGKILESDYLLLEAQYTNDKNNITDTQITRDNNLLTLKSLLSMNLSETLQIVYPDTAALSTMSLIPEQSYVLDRAMNTLPDLKIGQYNVDIANVGVKLAKSGYYPSVNLYGSMGTGHVNDYSAFGTQLSDGLKEQIGVSLSIPIFNNNRTKAKVTQSRIALQQAELNQKQTKLNILQNVSVEYQNTVSAYNKYKTTAIRQSAYLKTFDAYRAQFNAGAITAVDLLQQQNNYISVLNDFIQSKYGFMLQRKILDVYTGIPVTM